MTLNLQYNQMQSLEDLHDTRYHTVLIDKNYIRYLPVERLPMTLKKLSASENDLTYLELDLPFPHLEVLNLEKNNIYSVYMGDIFAHLETLNLRKNKIHYLDFLFHTPNLKNLDISFNRIDILQHLPPNLEILKANFCDITMIQSRLPSTLKECYLLGNELRMGALPLFWGTQLRILNLGDNKLRFFPKRLPDTIEELHLQSNLLESIPDILPSSLKHLNLSMNKIRSLPTKPNVRLDILIVAWNQLIENFDTKPLEWTKMLLANCNWNEEEYHTAQHIISKCWKRYILCKRLRHIARSHRIYHELLMIALHPDRILQTDTFSPGWFKQS